MGFLFGHKGIFVASLIYLVGLLFFGLYVYYSEKLEFNNRIDQKLINAAQSIDYLLPSNFHDKATHKDSIPSYLHYENVHKLTAHANNYGVKYIYTIVNVEGNLVFTSSSATKEEIMTGVNFTQYWDIYTEADKAFFNAIDSKEPIFSSYTDRWGSFKTVIIPATNKNKKIYLKCADIEVEYINSILIGKAIKGILGGLFLFIISLPLIFIIRRLYKRKSIDLTKLVEEKTRDLQLQIIRNKEAETILKYSEEKFARAFENFPAILFMTDLLTGTITEVNDGFLKSSGLKRTEVLGSYILTTPFFINVSDYEYIKKILEEKQSIKNLEINYCYRNENRIGMYYGEIIKLKNTNHILSIVFDITAQKKLENDLLIAKEKAETSDRLKSAFLANMSHEIRTPLNSIIGFSQLMKNEDINKEKQNEFLDIIHSNGNNLLTIINDIFDFSKIEAGQLKINFNDFNINDLLRRTYSVFNVEKNERGKPNIELKLLLELDDNQAWLRSDEIRIGQILNNLMTNAIKFTDNGSITLGYKVDKDFIHFFVKDTGIGIEESKFKIIFDRFQQLQTTKTRQFSGTGLGLSISKALIELMGGRIWVESKTGEGSCFNFKLPFRKPGVKDIDNSNNAVEEYENLISDLIVLVVDDDKGNLTLLNHILKKNVAKVYTASDGIEAVEIFKSIPEIKVVLLDINLPGQDGFTCMKQMREIRPEAKIIFQTALAISEEKENIEKSGVDDCLYKPIRQHELINALIKVINS